MGNFGGGGGGGTPFVLPAALAPFAVFPSFGTVGGPYAYEGPGCTDFLNPGSSGAYGPFGFSGFGNQAASIPYTTPSLTRSGFVELQTGVDAAGTASITTHAGAVTFGTNGWRYRADGFIPVASNGTDSFEFRAGFADTLGTGSDGAFFYYQHAVNGGLLTAKTALSFVETTTNLATAIVGTTIRSLEIDVNAAAASVRFSVNGVVVATHTTNIPSGAAKPLAAGFGIKKLLGTTSRSFVADLLGAAPVRAANI